MATTIFPRPEQPHTLPGLQLEEAATRAAPQQTKPTQPSPGNTSSSTSSATTQTAQYRVMSQDEWVQFCRGIGAFKDAESSEVARPTCWYWPPKGIPGGLYRDVLREKVKFTYSFHIVSILCWVLMILQLALNAILTALGSLSAKVGTVVTAIAGVNTLLAGLLALLHNSGLPDRYRSDRNEFTKLEEYIKEIVDTRVIRSTDGVVDVLAACFNKLADARQTVLNNVPATYSATPAKATVPPATQKEVPKNDKRKT